MKKKKSLSKIRTLKDSTLSRFELFSKSKPTLFALEWSLPTHKGNSDTPRAGQQRAHPGPGWTLRAWLRGLTVPRPSQFQRFKLGSTDLLQKMARPINFGVGLLFLSSKNLFFLWDKIMVTCLAGISDNGAVMAEDNLFCWSVEISTFWDSLTIHIFYFLLLLPPDSVALWMFHWAMLLGTL